MSLSAGARLAPYEIRARDTRLERDAVFMVLPSDLSSDPERRARFEREAKGASALSHPHIYRLTEGATTSHIALILNWKADAKE